MQFRKPKGAIPDSLPVINNVFHKHRFLFIHVPKCAGSSFSLNLLGYQVGHRSYKTYEALLGLELREYFTFSIVRHPLSRFKSAYSFIKRGGITSDDRVGQAKMGSANDVLMGLAKGEKLTIHFEPQVQFLQSRHECLTLSYIHKIENDFNELIKILRFYTDTFIADRIDAAFSADVVKNVGVSVEEEFHGLDVDLLYKVYEDDFWRLGYSPPNT